MDERTLGARLKAARIATKLTQNEVARKLGLTYQSISNYERDRCRVGSGILKQLCILYDVSPVELLHAPVWDAGKRSVYAAARTDADRLALFEQWGVPDTLAAEYRALTEAERAATADGGLSGEERSLLRLFRGIPAENRGMVLGMVEAALKSQGFLCASDEKCIDKAGKLV